METLKALPGKAKKALQELKGHLPYFQKKPKKWTKYIPYLQLYIRLPLFMVQTSVLTTRFETSTFEIIKAEIEVYKWSWYVSLYRKQF